MPRQKPAARRGASAPAAVNNLALSTSLVIELSSDSEDDVVGSGSRGHGRLHTQTLKVKGPGEHSQAAGHKLVAAKLSPVLGTSETDFLHLSKLSLRAEVFLEYARAGPYRKYLHGPARKEQLAAIVSQFAISIPSVGVPGAVHVYIATDELSATSTAGRTWYHCPLSDALPGGTDALGQSLAKLMSDGLLTVELSASQSTAASATNTSSSSSGVFSSTFQADEDDDEEEIVITTSAPPSGSALQCATLDLYLSLRACSAFTPLRPFIPASSNGQPQKAIATLLRHPLILSKATGQAGSGAALSPGLAAVSKILRDALVPYPASDAIETVDDGNNIGRGGTASASAPSSSSSSSSSSGASEPPTGSGSSHSHHHHPKLHAPLSEADIYAAAAPLAHEAGPHAQRRCLPRSKARAV